LSSVDLRYPRPTLTADYIRAASGAVLCGLPLVLVDVNRWALVILGAGLLLFASFFVRTALRQRTRYLLRDDTLCADGPVGGLVEWSRLDLMKLAYYSTKRDRTGGWMQLAVRSFGNRAIKVDSALDGFHDIVERAAQASEQRQLVLTRATLANLRSMGISIASQEEMA
jgi:hypothetical protein